MADLVARLREAIDAAESNPLHQLTCQMAKPVPEGFPFPTFSCNCDGPTERLRRCAADRKILDLHAASEDGKRCGSCADVDTAGIWRADLAPCGTLLALAEAYGVEA